MNLHKLIQQNENKEKLLKEVDEIMAMSGPKQWKAAANFYLKVSPVQASYEAQLVQKDVKDQREKVTNDTGASNSGSIRYALRFPEKMLMAIQMFDPDLFEGTVAEQRKTGQKLAKTFPEYAIPRRF